MKAVTYKTFGPPDVLKLVNHPLPQRSAGEVLVSVKSTSVNPVDYKTRNGSIPIARKNKVHLFTRRLLHVILLFAQTVLACTCRSWAVISLESSSQLTLVRRYTVPCECHNDPSRLRPAFDYDYS